MDRQHPAINDFSPLTLDDRDTFHGFLSSDPPRTSELTFTNLFMWRHSYRPQWREACGCLLVVMTPSGRPPFALPPVGSGDKAAALDFIFERMASAGLAPRLERAGGDFVRASVDPDRYQTIEDRDQSDYVYRTADLIHLPGRRYHQKKNHLNQFEKSTAFEVRPLDQDLVESALSMQHDWCRLRDCAASADLNHEDGAVYEALSHFGRLDYQGLAILVNGALEAFSLGEPLNEKTAVIHIEKANPEIRGLYAAVNQRACLELWSDYEFVNREQDLGVEGLRKAKESYQPDHMVAKYVVMPR